MNKTTVCMWPRTPDHFTPSPQITQRLQKCSADSHHPPFNYGHNWRMRPACPDQLTSGPLQDSCLISRDFCCFFKKKFPPIGLYRKRSFVLQKVFYSKCRKQSCRKKNWDFRRISSSKRGRIRETSLCMIFWCKMVN